MTQEWMILLLNIWYVCATIKPFLDHVFDPCFRTSLELSIVYIAFSVFPIIFEDVHSFTQSQEGLSFIGLGIGMAMATATQPLWNALDRRIAAKYAVMGQKPPPETMLYMAMAAAVLSPIGLLGVMYVMFHWLTIKCSI